MHCTSLRNRLPRNASAFLLGFMLASLALADTTALTVAAARKGTSNVPVTLQFPVTRSGDPGYPSVLNYHTADGTALAGTDYTAVSGTITLPAGVASATIPITLSANTSNTADQAFQLVLDSAVGIGPTPQMSAQQTFATGANPYSVTAADLNGDGKPDLIVANGGDNTVSVLFNTTAPGAASPSFAAQQTFATGAGPTPVATADLNGDGKPDLSVANYTGNTVSVLFNTTTPGATTPSFAAQQAFATGTGPFSVTAADLNGDGKPDLIAANLSDDTVSVLLNATSPGAPGPSFAAQQTFATGTQPIFVTASDLNGDGKPDLIATTISSNEVSVLFNTTAPGAATPSFAAQQTFATGTQPGFVTTNDLNGDGKPDLIVLNVSSNTVSVLLNTTSSGAAAPSFAARQTFATGTHPEWVTAADLNGDGKPDLVVANSGDNTVSVLLNTTMPGAAAPGFAAQQGVGAATDLVTISAADLNGDGKPDLIAANTNNSMVSVLLNTTVTGAATPSFAVRQTIATGAGPISVSVANLNGDGKPDLVVANYNSNTVSVLLNTTPPGAAAPSFAAQQFATGSTPDAVTAADLNGDGKPDLIVANYNNSTGNTVSVLFNTTPPGANTPSFATQQTFATGAGPSSVATADLNGDGKPDLVVANYTDNTVSVLFNTTAPGATTPSFATAQTLAPETSPYVVTTADLNGDGRADLVVANTNNNTVSVLLNTTSPGAPGPSFAAQQTFATGTAPSSITTADLDGDGKPDLVVANNTNSTVSVLFNNTTPGATTPSFVAQQTFAAGMGPNAVATADLNGDGKPDLVVANYAEITVLFNTQYQTSLVGSPATGTIVHDYLFSNGFE